MAETLTPLAFTERERMHLRAVLAMVRVHARRVPTWDGLAAWAERYSVPTDGVTLSQAFALRGRLQDCVRFMGWHASVLIAEYRDAAAFQVKVHHAIAATAV